jgi:DNA-binding MarR family transcriptional regulator
MSFEAIRWAFAQEIPGPEKLVLLVLANHADDERTCYPSMATIARETGTSRCNVLRVIPKIVERGLLSFEKRVTHHGKSSHLYTLSMTIKKAKTPCIKLRHPDVSKCSIEPSTILDNLPW